MNNAETLITRIQEIEKTINEEWIKNLSDRKKKEFEFHDIDRDRMHIEPVGSDRYEEIYGNRKYYQGVALSRIYVNKWIKNHVKDKNFLDYACGNGGNAINAAKAGARIAIGVDISPVSVKNAKKDAEKAGVQEKTYFLQSDAENTRLPGNSIDTIICSGVLHHLDLSYAFPELRRILAPDGIILAVEALKYNPAIRLYRYLTPKMRTDWERAHILSLADIRFARRFFDIGEMRYWHITSILTPFAKKLLPFFNTIDNILTKVTWIQLMAWIFTFELIKRER